MQASRSDNNKKYLSLFFIVGVGKRNLDGIQIESASDPSGGDALNIFNDLLGRAQAVSPECRSLVVEATEDLETIALEGYKSRAFAPEYRPNETDIIDFLENAVSNGFSKAAADQIISAWNEN